MRVTLVLTHNCNLGCDYCFAGLKFARKMSPETAYQALQLGFGRPAREQLQVSFFGGEPMMEFPLMAQVTRLSARLAARQGRDLDFSLTCNGTLLEPVHLQFFRHYGFHVAISVDGWGDYQDRHRRFIGGRSSARVVWSNLQRALEYLPRLHVMSVVSPDTVAGLADLVERLYRLGVVSQSLLPDCGADWDENSRSQVKQAYCHLAGLSSLAQDTDVPFYLAPFAELHPSWPRPVVHCAFGEGDVTVSPAGNLYPCARMVGTDRRPELRMGNLRDGVQAEALAALRQGQNGLCRCVGLCGNRREVENQQFFASLVNDAVQACR